MRRSLIACCLAVFALVPRGARPETPPQQPASKLTLEAALAPDAYGRRPLQQAWSPDGKRLVYLWDADKEPEAKAFWSFDTSTGRSEILARLADLGNPGEKGEEKAKDFELGAYSWSPRGDSLLVVSKGDLYLLSLQARKLRRLTHTEAEEEDARFSPDGRRIAYSRALDFYVLDVASGQETRLTRDGRSNTTLNGVNDWVYAEEIWGREPRAFWWSPDSQHLAYYRFDERSTLR